MYSDRWLSALLQHNFDSTEASIIKLNLSKLLTPAAWSNTQALQAAYIEKDAGAYISSINAGYWDFTKSDLYISRDKHPVFVNEALPVHFVGRTFIRKLAAATYDIHTLPGNIVEMGVDSNLTIVTLKSISLPAYKPKLELLDNEILYDNRINDKASFNASFLIGGLSVEKDRMMQLIIQDVAKSSIPDSFRNDKKVAEILKKIPAARRKNLFYISGAVLTTVTSKKYDKSSYSSKVNTNWLTAEGSVFMEATKFSKDRLVSLDLIALDTLIGLSAF